MRGSGKRLSRARRKMPGKGVDVSRAICVDEAMDLCYSPGDAGPRRESGKTTYQKR
jgi:hypothetical protein